MDLRDFIQEVLDNEFPGERKKREIHDTRNGYNFACPFCGEEDYVFVDAGGGGAYGTSVPMALICSYDAGTRKAVNRSERRHAEARS